MTTWIVVADSSRARIFEAPNRGRQIEEIMDMVNLAGREAMQDIVTDNHDRFQTAGAAGTPNGSHSMGRAEHPAEHEIEMFAKRLSAYVDKARTQVRYDQLCLVAPPKFLGLLRGNLAKESHKLLKREISKDLSKFDAPTILEYVRRLPDS